MSLSVNPARASMEYCPAPLWLPPPKEYFRLRRLGAAVLHKPDDPAVERDLMEGISAIQGEILPFINNSPPYRASKAIEHGSGNCMAVAELILGCAQTVGLASFLLWDNSHALALIRGRHNWWVADNLGFGIAGSKPQLEVVSDVYEQDHAKLLKEVIDQSGGRAFIQRHPAPIRASNSPEWQPIRGSLGGTNAPYDYTTMVLPAIEAPIFMSAYGDLRRYVSTKPHLWKEYGSQILQYIPRNWAAQTIKYSLNTKESFYTFDTP